MDWFCHLKTLKNELEYVGRRFTTNVDVPGNIHKPHFRDFWCEDLKASEFFMKTLEEGYELPFSSTPPPSLDQNYASARNDLEFVTSHAKLAVSCPVCHGFWGAVSASFSLRY